MDTNKKPSLGDRYSDWAVIVVTLVAVLLGWLLMSNVQSRSVAFDSGGVKGQMPAGWVTDLAEVGVVLHTTELGGSGFAPPINRKCCRSPATQAPRMWPVSTRSTALRT
jgi:hypothetical protein